MDFIESIKNFPKQLSFEPIIENGDKIKPFKRLIFVGMGGSALGPDLLRILRPDLDIWIHRDYDLPSLPDSAFNESLVVLNSYSGNTIEVLTAFEEATKRGLNMAAVSIGGRLLELAKNFGAPHIQMTDMETQPRLALGLNLKAIFKLIGDEDLLRKFESINLDYLKYENAGNEIANEIKGSIPIVYSSRENGPLSYVWKVVLNETVKIPAFSNVFPELNHNEMAGFESAELSKDFYYIFLRDSFDRPDISKRMDATLKVISGRDLRVRIIELEGSDKPEKVLNSLILAYWAGYYLAKNLGVDPEGIKIIEDFKKAL